MEGIYIQLGSNLGDRLLMLKKAIHQLMINGIKILEESSIYETAPWGETHQPWFLNVVLQIETSQNPYEMLETMLGIERTLGRVRDKKWTERLIDIDLLYYHNEIINKKKLIVPQAQLVERRFTLLPMTELCPEDIHPVLQLSQSELLFRCNDSLDCLKTDLKL